MIEALAEAASRTDVHGYPPFRGGPLRYMDTLGAAEVVRILEGLTLADGPRFTPAPVLREIARTGETFHTD